MSSLPLRERVTVRGTHSHPHPHLSPLPSRERRERKDSPVKGEEKTEVSRRGRGNKVSSLPLRERVRVRGNPPSRHGSMVKLLTSDHGLRMYCPVAAWRTRTRQ